ncbi:MULTISPECIES: hypothetical protein [unclassified Arthrobacter]|uniref:hypothetical protein n=1 Tax=unclassified Arthrobacter TaxID=235627 RepID=UPI0012DE74AC|nr:MULTISPECIES: hypothetical protein [unclassified Arthrobacter]BCW56404.1 hypothetical protein StoSoilB19_37780 [Arthrobacter sp. StoSoilB19]
MSQLHVVRILIASPGDCEEERFGLTDALQLWNVAHADEMGIYLWPWLWETCSVASYGQDGQAELNDQLVEKADACVAFFRRRLGSGTPRAESGTVEEIEGAADRGLKPGVHFLNDGKEAEGKEAARLSDYKKKLQDTNRYYYVPYSSVTNGVNKALASAVKQARAAIVAREGAGSVNIEKLDEWTQNAESSPVTETTTNSIKLSTYDFLGKLYGELVSKREEAANRDWTFEVNDMETGWDLTNSANIPLSIDGYRVVLEDEGTGYDRVLWEMEQDNLIQPNQTIEILPDYLDDREAYGARLEVSYSVGNHSVDATIRCSSEMPERMEYY